MLNDAPQLSPGWHKAKIIGEILIGIGALLIPLVIQISSSKYTNTLKEREIGTHYVEVAIGILLQDPSKQNTKELRMWAIDVINKYSDVKLSASAKKDLLEKKLAPLPTSFGRGPYGAQPWGSPTLGDQPLGDKTLGD